MRFHVKRSNKKEKKTFCLLENTEWKLNSIPLHADVFRLLIL
ncbi:MAG: hypothetical protein ACOYK5_01765 [Bacteroidia bacterium]